MIRASLFFLPLLTLLLMASSGRAWAWSDGGHKTIALIAYERLQESEREWVVSILAKHPLWQMHFADPMKTEIGEASDKTTRTRWLFAQASVWPDKVRPPRGSKTSENPLKEYHHGSWHYTDVPVFIDEVAKISLAKHDKPPFTNWWPKMYEPKAGWDSVQVLKKAMHNLADTGTSAPEKALMLCWLFHLTGDMHQPCHCSSLYAPDNLPNGDRGANSLTLTGMNGKPLHAYWDELLNGRGSDLKGASETARMLLGDAVLMKTADAAPHTKLPEDWLMEGWRLSSARVYSPALRAALKGVPSKPYTHDGQTYQMIGFHLSGPDFIAYKEQAEATARQQAAIAGVRLADVLRGIITK